ncbi:MAG: hypothetical protein HND48_11505 [Chloroflexi bacterium]|nr:hypothetical protein [Chloroflexota bacterium]
MDIEAVGVVQGVPHETDDLRHVVSTDRVGLREGLLERQHGIHFYVRVP